MDDLTPRSLHLFIGAIKKKSLILTLKERRFFFFLFLFDADENASRWGFSAEQNFSIQPDNRIKRRISSSLIFRD